ncbi:MAG: PilN domain-containing protein [Nitrospirae bacterium]|nr:PilN domain-containing protein [Nitrospirota bacterium]
MAAITTIKKFVSITSDSATKLKRIGKPLWHVLTFSPADERILPQKAICANIEKGKLSVLYASRLLSKIKIKGYIKYPFEEDRYPTPEGFASSLSLAINNLDARTAYVVLSIPKAWAVIKTAEFPSTIRENLSNAVSYELDRLTPFNIDDALYDFRILKEDTDKLTLLIMAAKVDLIKPYIDALKERGIDIKRVTVSLSSIGTLCSYFYEKGDIIFIEVHKNEYEGGFLNNGSVVETFTGSFSTKDEKLKPDIILSEITPLVDTFKNEGKRPQIVILIKGNSFDFENELKSKLNLPIKILTEKDLKIKSSEPLKDISYASLGGIIESLWPKSKGLNLLKKGIHERQKTPFVLTALLILIILGMYALYMLAPLRIEKKRLEEIDYQISLRREDVKKIEALKKEIDSINEEVSTIRNFKRNKPLVLDILKELTNILPETAWLTRVRIIESAVEIEGYASSATGLLSKLEASKYFRRAEFASPTFRDTRQNADRFIIKMEIEGIKKEVIKKPSLEEPEDEEE